MSVQAAKKGTPPAASELDLQLRSDGLGALHVLPDHVLSYILFCLDGLETIATLTCVSRIFRVLCCEEQVRDDTARTVMFHADSLGILRITSACTFWVLWQIVEISLETLLQHGRLAATYLICVANVGPVVGVALLEGSRGDAGVQGAHADDARERRPAAAAGGYTPSTYSAADEHCVISFTSNEFTSSC